MDTLWQGVCRVKKEVGKLLKLSSLLHYHFNDIDLLKLALTHRSIGANNNERLEYLGDSLVNLIIAEAAYRRHSKANEGELSRWRSSLVSGEALSEVGFDFDLGNYVYLGQGELKSGGHKRASIMACAVEAIIGAIYLDSDYETCKTTVLRWFESRLGKLSLENEYKDAKTQLQEFLQGRKMPLPIYTLIKTEGQAHEQVFTVQCTATDLDLKITATATTRRKAEKIAAQQLLEVLINDK